MEVRYDPRDGFARITFTGRWPSEAEQADVTRTLKELDSSTALLIDIRRVDTETVPHHEELMARARRALSEIPRRRAYVVHEGAQFAIARMIQTLVPEGPEIEVFTEEKNAIGWLTRSRK
jgi:hypothetical protein